VQRDVQNVMRFRFRADCKQRSIDSASVTNSYKPSSFTLATVAVRALSESRCAPRTSVLPSTSTVLPRWPPRYRRVTDDPQIEQREWLASECPQTGLGFQPAPHPDRGRRPVSRQYARLALAPARSRGDHSSVPSDPAARIGTLQPTPRRTSFQGSLRVYTMSISKGRAVKELKGRVEPGVLTGLPRSAHSRRMTETSSSEPRSPEGIPARASRSALHRGDPGCLYAIGRLRSDDDRRLRRRAGRPLCSPQLRLTPAYPSLWQRTSRAPISGWPRSRPRLFPDANRLEDVLPGALTSGIKQGLN
jgi:hypothetical protein